MEGSSYIKSAETSEAVAISGGISPGHPKPAIENYKVGGVISRRLISSWLNLHRLRRSARRSEVVTAAMVVTMVATVIITMVVVVIVIMIVIVIMVALDG
jgi:hypothetical protein